MSTLRVLTRKRFLALSLFASFFFRRAIAAASQQDLSSILTPLLASSGLPAIAAAAIRKGTVAGAGAVGVRKVGSPTAVTVNDRFHIGSDTKAMTATLVAMLVEEGKLKWESTLEEIFPERASKMHSSYRKVTLDLLLRHRAGTPENSHSYGTPAQTMITRRLGYLDSIITKAPQHEPNTTFSYSNAGYIILGAILERVSGKQWEMLIQERLFRPLKMDSAGFGPPSKPEQADQPWGHANKDGKFAPRYGDNPAPLGPAGTVHCTVVDYLKFADFHASMGSRPEGLLKPDSFKKLQTPRSGETYAMGWGTGKRGWAKGRVLSHAGSNTMNYFITWIAPEIELSIAVAINAAGGDVAKHADEVCAELIQKFAA